MSETGPGLAGAAAAEPPSELPTVIDENLENDDHPGRPIQKDAQALAGPDLDMTTVVAEPRKPYPYPFVTVKDILMLERADADDSGARHESDAPHLDIAQTKTLLFNASNETLPQSNDTTNEPPWKAMPVATSNEDAYEGSELHQDVFTLFFLSTPGTTPFIFSVIVIMIQYMIYGLLLWSLLEDDDPYRDTSNVLKVPPYVDSGVIMAQYIALLIAVVTQEDLMNTIELIRVGYDPSLLASHPSATHGYWVASCILRFVEGAVGVAIAFVFIVQSSNVIDIFLNFAAVEFVANLDDVGFKLADNGLIGRAAQAATRDAKEITLPLRHRTYRKTRQVVVFASIAVMVCCLVWLQKKQRNGDYIKGTSCGRLEVSFPEEFYELNHPLDVTNSQRSFDLIDVTQPRSLIYPFFSGEYVVKGSLVENRPVYYERGHDDVTSGMFYYCKQEKAWVYTIRVVAKDDRPKSDCKFGWLMQSPLTEAFNLEDVGPDGWQVWTESGSIKEADLGFTCNQCFRNSDCGGHGSCTTASKTCACDDNHTGSRCKMEKPFCPFVENVVYGDSALDYTDYKPAELVMRNGEDVLLYNRPTFHAALTNQTQTNLIFYSGTRWFYSGWDSSTLEAILARRPTDINSFHAYWHLDITSGLFEVSDPTDSESPVGLRWNGLVDAIGESAPYGVSFPLKQDYLCYGKCDNDKNVCGSSGACDAKSNLCVCENGNGGIYCEFGINTTYVWPLVNYYLQFANESWFDRMGFAYDVTYLSNISDDELFREFQTVVAGN